MYNNSKDCNTFMYYILYTPKYTYCICLFQIHVCYFILKRNIWLNLRILKYYALQSITLLIIQHGTH